MKYLLCSLILFAQMALLEARAEAFAHHVSTAFDINKERKELYSELTQGQSEKVSNRMLLMEASLLPIAKVMDIEASYFHKHNIPVLKIELMPMALGEFAGFTGFQATVFNSMDINFLKTELGNILESENFEKLSQKADDYLNSMREEQGAHCMVRHFLESIRRTANYAPIHISHAEALGLKSPKSLIKRFISLHLTGMKKAEKIDSLAFEFQAQGLPIVCQDLPYIPEW